MGSRMCDYRREVHRIYTGRKPKDNVLRKSSIIEHRYKITFESAFGRLCRNTRRYTESKYEHARGRSPTHSPTPHHSRSRMRIENASIVETSLDVPIQIIKCIFYRSQETYFI